MANVSRLAVKHGVENHSWLNDCECTLATKHHVQAGVIRGDFRFNFDATTTTHDE